MATTWNAIYLGQHELIDENEGWGSSNDAERASRLLNQVFTGPDGAPLHQEIYSVTPVNRGG